MSTIPIRSRILECCQERRDEWEAEVENRILSCIDLVAAEAVYHDFCRTRFMLKKDLGKKISGSMHHDGGRHQDKQMNSNFTLLIKWFEAEAAAELYMLTGSCIQK